MDELQAGVELDALVAERVMGWVWDNPHGSFEILVTKEMAQSRDYSFTLGRGKYQFVPQYSIDIAAAWALVERMNQIGRKSNTGIGCLKLQDTGNFFAASFGHPDLEDEEWWEHADDYTASAMANSAPLAICRAALKSAGEV